MYRDRYLCLRLRGDPAAKGRDGPAGGRRGRAGPRPVEVAGLAALVSEVPVGQFVCALRRPSSPGWSRAQCGIERGDRDDAGRAARSSRSASAQCSRPARPWRPGPPRIARPSRASSIMSPTRTNGRSSSASSSGSALESLTGAIRAGHRACEGCRHSPGARTLREKRLRGGCRPARSARRPRRRPAASDPRRGRAACRRAQVLAPRERGASGELEPILHAAYLVPRAPGPPNSTSGTGLAVGPAGFLRLEASGPWPPSHFCPRHRPALTGDDPRRAGRGEARQGEGEAANT